MSNPGTSGERGEATLGIDNDSTDSPTKPNLNISPNQISPYVLGLDDCQSSPAEV